VWSYDPTNDRTEDPDHGTEDLRLAIRLVRLSQSTARSLFSESVLARMLRTWFDLGLNEHDCFTNRIDGDCNPCNATRLADSASRTLFLLR
jgi:hypothetical protein